MAEKPCKVCNFTRQNLYGLAAPSLGHLKMKGSEVLGFSPGASVSVVLEDDGTIVEDEAYFLCLNSNTKFMLLCDGEVWRPAKKYDGGTAWLSRESVDVERDMVDNVSGVEPWCSLAHQLKQDLASIILMSEADLQSLVDAPCADLASVLGFPDQKTQDLQDTLQRVLDRREEERQSKELLQLYLKVVEKERGQTLQQEGQPVQDERDGMEVDGASGFNSRTLLVLKGRASPETRLSNEELQEVLKQGVETLMDVLDWDRERTTDLVQACEGELNKRLQQVQALQSLSAHSQQSKSTSAESHEEEPQTKRHK
ncbi:DNA fragmentation factor subunit alpha [Pygocentrus nattereri]|uniref:CIDE-N domain-containing protein n=1 Tax=Pygocentrus nattereri TaxID=42514 RepID=A0A3B4EER7_PYGNA|nr:DNA fragmentation factor subunit alpha [Pygocentrus nattereri]